MMVVKTQNFASLLVQSRILIHLHIATHRGYVARNCISGIKKKCIKIAYKHENI